MRDVVGHIDGWVWTHKDTMKRYLRPTPLFILLFETPEDDGHRHNGVPLQPLDDLVDTVTVDTSYGFVVDDLRGTAEMVVQGKVHGLVVRHAFQLTGKGFKDSDGRGVGFDGEIHGVAFVFAFEELLFVRVFLGREKGRIFTAVRRHGNNRIIQNFLAQWRASGTLLTILQGEDSVYATNPWSTKTHLPRVGAADRTQIVSMFESSDACNPADLCPWATL